MAAPLNPTQIRLGYIPLVDSAPLLVAQRLDFFKKRGLNVELLPQPGWASVRERLVYGEIDAAQCLGPLAIAINQGIGTRSTNIVVPLVLNANGNAITLSKTIPPEVLSQPDGLLNFLNNDWKNERALTLAAVHPFSSHYALLTQWLKQHKVLNHPRIQVVTLPPQVVVRNLASGTIDGFCVGEPWNSAAILDGQGWCAATSTDLSSGHPEKVLAVRSHLATEQPEVVTALTAALLEACEFCQDKSHRETVTEILTENTKLSVESDAILNSLNGIFETGLGEKPRKLPDFHIFHGPGINSPDTRASSWLLEGVRQVGLLSRNQSFPQDSVFRMDLFEEAQKQILAS